MARREWPRAAALLMWHDPIGRSEVEGAVDMSGRRGRNCPAARGGVC